MRKKSYLDERLELELAVKFVLFIPNSTCWSSLRKRRCKEMVIINYKSQIYKNAQIKFYCIFNLLYRSVCTAIRLNRMLCLFFVYLLFFHEKKSILGRIKPTHKFTFSRSRVLVILRHFYFSHLILFILLNAFSLDFLSNNKISVEMKMMTTENRTSTQSSCEKWAWKAKKRRFSTKVQMRVDREWEKIENVHWIEWIFPWKNCTHLS